MIRRYGFYLFYHTFIIQNDLNLKCAQDSNFKKTFKNFLNLYTSFLTLVFLIKENLPFSKPHVIVEDLSN